MIRFLPVLLLVACSVQAGEPHSLSEFRSVRCEGSYPHHLQGVCTDEREADEPFANVQRHESDCSLGIVPIGNGRFLVGRGTSSKEGCTGRLVLAEADTERGLTDGPSATVGFRQSENSIEILVGDKPVAEYIFRDDEILRPYFRHLRTLSGVQVTRNHPPVKGQDRDDHATMHPGLWLAFGDLNGADYWRNRAQVRHIGFVEKPHGDVGSGAFAVRNAYEADGKTICTEDCEITISVRPAGYLLNWESTFRSEQDAFTFGDQEEMGLGVRVATPLAVVHGGQITDSESRKNEAEVWGRQAAWCQYGGTMNGQQVGVVLMPDVQNFRRSWFHARDYGVLVANPFGQNAFMKGKTSKVTVQKGETFRLGFGVLIYGVPSGEAVDIAAAYRAYAGRHQVQGRRQSASQTRRHRHGLPGHTTWS